MHTTVQQGRHNVHQDGAVKTRERSQQHRMKTRRITSNVGLHYKTSFSQAKHPSQGHQQWDKLKRLHDNNMLLYSTQGRQYMEYKSKVMKKISSTSSEGGSFAVKDCLGNCFIRSNSRFRKSWDLWLSLLILYSCIIIPYRVGFDVDTSALGWTLESLVIDVFFAIDLVLNFFTFESDKWGHRSTTFRSNSWRYLRTWFLIDFFSTIPFDQLLGVITDIDKNAVRTIKLVRVVRLTRLLKLVRLLKLRKSAVQVFSKSHTIQHAVWRIIKLLFSVLFLAHLLACFWHFMALMADQEDETWLSTLNLYSPYTGVVVTPETMTMGDLYVSSFYWVIATMMAVGYGDVHAVNSWERIFSIVTMIVGAAFFGVMVANISGLLETLNARSNAFRRKMETVKAYMKDRKLPKTLQSRIRGYYVYYFSQKSLFNEEEVLGSLSTTLRNELVAHTNSRVIDRVHFFKNQDPSLTTALLTRMKPLFRITDEVLGVEGDIAKEMFFLVHGVVEMLATIPDVKGVAPILPSMTPLASLAASREGKVEEIATNDAIPAGSSVVGVLMDGDQFGDPELLLQCRRPCGFRAASVCDLQTLSKQDLEFVLYDFPQVRESMVSQARHRLHLLDAVKASLFISSTLEQLDPRTSMTLHETATEATNSSAPQLKKSLSKQELKVIKKEEKQLETKRLKVLGSKQSKANMLAASLESEKKQSRTPGKAASKWAAVKDSVLHHVHTRPGTDGATAPSPAEMLAEISRQLGRAQGQLTYFDAATCVFAAAEVALSLNGWELAKQYAQESKVEGFVEGTDLELDDSYLRSRANSQFDLPHLRSPLLANAYYETKALEAASNTPMSPTLLRGALEGVQKEVISASNRHLHDASPRPKTSTSRVTPANSAIVSAEVDQPSSVASKLFEATGVKPLIDEWIDPLGKRAIELGVACRKILAAKRKDPSNARIGYGIADILSVVRSSRYRSRLLMGPLALQGGNVVMASELPTGLLQRNTQNGEQVVRTVREVKGLPDGVEGVETEASIRSRHVLHPRDRNLMKWDLFMAIAILFSVLEVPFILAFVPEFSLGVTILEVIIDCIFAADLVLRFRVAYLDRERDLWETRPRRIAKHYLSHEFVLDFISTFPFDHFADLATTASSEAFRSLKLIRTIRLVRLLKLFRVARFRKYLTGASDSALSLSPAMMQLFSLAFQVTLVAHFLGCFFFLVTTGMDETQDLVWWIEEDIPKTVLQQYIASLYWGFTTMTTVGYGDLTPASTLERVYATVAMLIGATVFGYIVGSVAGIVLKLNASAVKYDQKMEEISEYLRDIRVPKTLRDRVMTYYEYFLARRSAFDEDTILADLSDSIRREVRSCMGFAAAAMRPSK